LANKTETAKLGKVEKFEVGLKMNRVCPAERTYHFEQTKIGRKTLTLNTENVERTVAWFIEVIAGCTFQCCFENKEFKLCFGHENNKIGSIDFWNLSAVRNLSAFNWTFDQIYEMQKDFKEVVEKHNLVDKIKPIADDIKLKVKNSLTNQITIEKTELEELNIEFEKVVSDEMFTDYLQLVLAYKKKMTEKPADNNGYNK
jgi:hypothetical protein